MAGDRDQVLWFENVCLFEDPAANLVLGKQLCFIEANWPEGLACLVKSNDALLKDLAEKSPA